MAFDDPLYDIVYLKTDADSCIIVDTLSFGTAKFKFLSVC